VSSLSRSQRQSVVIIRLKRFEGEGIVDQVEGLVEAAAVHEREAQEVQGFGAGGLFFEAAGIRTEWMPIQILREFQKIWDGI
jgi:hypothetical protein